VAILAGVAAIVVLGLAIYANSFSVPLLTENLRPVAYLTFGLNYAVHGIHVWGYHAVNLAIHTAAALVLFGLVRRTLSRGHLAARYGRHSCGMGLTVALLWMAHPLQTESVTYVVQRIESLMGLFYLLTLYCFLRGQESVRLERRVGTEDAAGRLKVSTVSWYVGSVVCCALGMATKEVMVTAPVMVLWYDRVFVASSWREILRRRGGFYIPLACTWGLLAFLMLSKSSTYVSAGALVVEGVSPLQYALSQPGVILHYLRLSFWPWGQCIDYGWPVAQTAGQIVPPLVAVIGLLGATVWCMFRRPQWGFVGGWFFVVLGPTSSVAPIKDLAFEHRMYLSLAAIVLIIVIGGYELIERLVVLRVPNPALRRVVQIVPVLATVAVLGYLTYLRNEVYQSGVSLWLDVVHKAPKNERGYVNLGAALANEGNRFNESESRIRQALEIRPENATALNNLGLALVGQDRLKEAAQQFQQALRLRPKYVPAHRNLGRVMEKLGDPDRARKCYQRALTLNPGNPETLFLLGVFAENQGRLEEAMQRYRRAARTRPHYVDAHNSLAMLATQQGALDEAVQHLRSSLWHDPDQAQIHYDLAYLLRTTQPDRAIKHYRAALRIEPEHVSAHNNLGALLADRGDLSGAIDHYEEVLKLNPQHAHAHLNLAIALARQSRVEEAAQHLDEALRIKPEYAPAVQQHPDLKAALKHVRTRPAADGR